MINEDGLQEDSQVLEMSHLIVHEVEMGVVWEWLESGYFNDAIGFCRQYKDRLKYDILIDL